jgi:membrane fusion protein, multidrug efflux system
VNRMLMGLSAAVACVALAACKPTQQAAAPSAPPPAVGVIVAEMKGVKPALSFIGRVKAVDTVQLRARVEGFLEKILFKEGQYVKTGDLLYQIEKTQYQATVDQAKANVAAAEALELNAQFQFNRASELVKTQSGTQATVDTTRAALDSAKASVLQNKAAETIAEENLSYTDISSPIDGRIGLTAFTQGNLVNPASGVLATIVSDDPIYAEFPVSMRQIADLTAAHKQDLAGPIDIKAYLTLANGQQYDRPGTWNFVANQVDPQTDTLIVRAIFPNPQRRLVDGAYVTVRVEEAEQQQRLVIPRSTLQLDQIGVYVLTVNDEQKVEVKRVATGEAVNTEIAIVSGLQAGDRVIVDGVQKVRPGQTVQATEVAPSDGAAK